MNDLNEQILFFNDICFEDSYLNEGEANNTNNNQNGNQTNDGQLNDITQNVIKKYQGKMPVEDFIAKQNNQQQAQQQNVNQQEDAEKDNEENQQQNQEENPDPADLAKIFKSNVHLTVNLNSFDVISLDDIISQYLNKQNNGYKVTNIAISALSDATGQVTSANALCGFYTKINYGLLQKQLEKNGVDLTTINPKSIEQQIDKLIEERKANNQSIQHLVVVYGLRLMPEVSDLKLNKFKVEYECEKLAEKTTVKAAKERRRGEIVLDDFTLGTVTVKSNVIIEVLFTIPAARQTITFDSSINLLDFVSVRFDGNPEIVNYNSLDNNIKKANPIEFVIKDEEVKNVIKLNNGVLSLDQNQKDSFEKLLAGDNSLKITVDAYLKNKTDLVSEAEITALKNPSEVDNFLLTETEPNDKTVGDPDIDTNLIIDNVYPGKKRYFYISILPKTALPAYYYLECELKDKSAPITLTKVKEDKDKNYIQYEVLVNENADVNALTAKQKQIKVRLVNKKATTGGSVIMNGSKIKTITLDINEIPTDLSVEFDSSSALELNYDQNGDLTKDISNDIKLFNNKVQITLDDLAGLNDDIKIGFASADTSIAEFNNGTITLKGDGTTDIYVYLTSTFSKGNNKPADLPDVLSNIKDIVSFDTRQLNVSSIIREFKIDIPPKPKAYDLIMAPVVGGKAGKVFGIRHYVVDPQREINETNDRATSLLNKANPVKFFSDVIKKYSTYKASNMSNKKAKRADNAQEPSRENRIMSNTKVDRDFDDRNAHTWKESVEFEEILKQYGYLTEATTNKLDWQEDLEKCTTYFKEVYNQYITSLNIIYGDNTENFASAIKEEFIKQFQIKITGKNPLHDYNVCQAILRSAAGQLGRKNDNIAAYKKLGEELDAFAEDTNKTMIDRIEAAFASLLTGKVKDGSEKTRIPMDQSYLKNLWFGYYRKLKRDAVKFQQKFLNSDAFMYARKVHNTTIPDILSLCLACIAMIVEQHLQELDLKEIKDYDWALLFNVSLNKVEAEGQSNLRELQKEKQVYADRWNEALRQSKIALEQSAIWKGSAFERKINGADIDKLYKFAADPSNTCTYDLAPNTGISKVISEINKVVAKASMTNPNINALQNELNDVCNKIIWATIK